MTPRPAYCHLLPNGCGEGMCRMGRRREKVFSKGGGAAPSMELISAGAIKVVSIKGAAFGCKAEFQNGGIGLS